MPAPRGQHRHHLIFYLKVHDLGAGKPLGFLGNVTPEGMLVVGDQALDVGRSFEIEIGECTEAGPAHAIRCRARSVWSKIDADPAYYATGFRFEAVPAASMRAIRTLIQDIGFDG
jgi:hypothetical protein